jgi:glycerol-3-phosphate dehydrogenase (NAD(P)+)
MKITIIGNGQIGNAILYLLKESKKNDPKFLIEIYDKDETKNISGKTLKECLLDTDFVFLCVPSWCLITILKEINIYAKKEVILISLSKGIESNSRKSVDELIKENVKNVKFALLSGPMFAKEITENKMSFAFLATKDKETSTKILNLFKNTKLKLEYSNKVHDVAISGVLKNIYTLIVSTIDSSSEDNNIRGFLSAKAVVEMLEIASFLKIDKKIILGTAGLGDFIATVSSIHSQNRKVGKDISDNGNTRLMSEGLMSLPSLEKMLGKKINDLPLFSLLVRITIKNKNPKTEIEKFFKEI